MYLNKNPSRKKTMLEAYRRVIAETWPIGIVAEWKKWLEGPLNTNYRRWPPNPAQLGCIIEKLIKYKKMALKPSPHPELFLHRLVVLFYTGHKNIFNEHNNHLKISVVKVIACMIHNRPIYAAALRFVGIFKEMRKTSLPYPAFEKMLLKKNRERLISKIGLVDISVLMQFLWETHWDSEISRILDKWYK
jgi:hypothetical protein